MREYCANTREIVNLHIISISNGFAGCKDSSIHHTSNNIANVSALVTRFIKICDRDSSLSLERVKQLTE
ncbi:hypothetical protein D5F51_19820 [Yersinia hibernica]|uniref:Uncharacterized protein n=2 Tax=Yersinia TaxID=629 RepID=A0ABX5R4H6_9GAMM|nr:hypothetical protein LC20_06550 [Yersinia hibernica]OVZ82467.1 hypothetical protein CBW54_16965 [Yersinia kristensenii]QAX80570.1 hypothetical protein D5F51_19820 [Yersinia hibernica]